VTGRFAVLGVALLAAACGGDGERPAPTARPAVPDVTTVVAATQPVRGVVRAFGQVAPSGEPTELRDARTQVAEAEARQRLADEQLRRLSALAPAVAPRKELDAARAEADGAAAALARGRQALAAFGDAESRPALPAGQAWVIARIVQRDLPAVAAGAGVRFTADALPDGSFTGQVDAPAAYVEPDTRTAPVRLRVQDPGQALRPGMTGAVAIEVGTPHPAVVVPEAAVVYDAAQPVVFVAEADGRFTPHPVRLGVVRDGAVEVVSGVDAGATVVTTGAASLLSATQLPAGDGED